ncbi:MAG TPA: alkaline phosphatase family protein [Phycisphaerae bacterium]|nr:alkaline phosphatase family protein [Phycisphaerae bacterium]
MCRSLQPVTIASFLAAAVLIAGCDSPSHTGKAYLTTGKGITATGVQNVASMPMNMIASPNGRFAISSDMGQREALWVIDTRTGLGLSHLDYSNRSSPRRNAATRPSAATKPAPAERLAGGEDAEPTKSGSPLSNGLYYGLAISPDNILYAAQGAHDSIAILHLSADGQLSADENPASIRTRPHDFPAGLALDNRNLLYVANNASGLGDPFSLHGSIAIYDTTTKSEVGRYTFTRSYGGTSNFPYGIAATRDGRRVYVASERDDAVYSLDCSNPAQPALVAPLHTGAHPVSLLLSADQSRLYVSNSLGDTITVIDTHTDQITNTILLRPAMVRDLPGVTPLGLSLSPDGRTLYAALADMNAVAVIDTDSLNLRGYLPAGWYPTSVIPTPDGKQLLVANAKGTSLRNPNGHLSDPVDPKRKFLYVLNALEGNISMLAVPSAAELSTSTEKVLEQNRLTQLAAPQKNPLADISLAAGKIKHVLYIIKENRTYDQVLGDLKQGNSDPSLTLFGKNVTPNQHALAERFVLLDNVYASGEVSGDGWVWSTQGMADAYVARNVPYSYSRRGRKFDFEGANNGYPTGGAPAELDGKPLATTQSFKNGVPPIPDVANTGRNIWDAAKEARISLRNYGFFLFFNDKNSGTPGGPDNYPAAIGLQPAGHDLAGLTDIDYRRFDLDYPDSDAPLKYFTDTHDSHALFPITAFGQSHAPNRFTEWNREFQMMLAKDPNGNAVPNLMLIRLPNDHTNGASAGSHTPQSYVADNDYGVGELVEAVSKSPIWNSTAIFIIEDDAQGGADHVDCHRTTGYIISPFIKAHAIDHRFYNTDSFLKTMELLLGLKPLCQYDAVADPIQDWTTTPDNIAPYEAQLPAKEIITDRNPTIAELPAGDPRIQLAQRSAQMDFTHPDAAPAQEANAIIWKTVKGPNSEMPAPRNAIPTGKTAAGKDDDD